MATLVFNTGKRVEIEHTKAAVILQVLNGEREPEDEKQAEFVTQIKDVIFPQLPMGIRQRKTKSVDKEQANSIKKINADTSLSEKQKFEAIGKVLRGEKL
ncbi:MAG: hypothetical protein E6R04_09815 [Spirochaetes bacterium]|nr:MAG: hypothetical protein E6R04_09815 [Spirochaetota bacterium]